MTTESAKKTSSPSIWEVLVAGTASNTDDASSVTARTTSPLPPNGYFGPPNAPINWCESDYQHSFYVAELFNTITNVCYVLVGFYMLRLVYQKRKSIVAIPVSERTQKLPKTKRQSSAGFDSLELKRAPELAPTTHDMVCLCTILTGVFSGLFHASLQYEYQRLDEIFENGILIFMLHSKRSTAVGAIHFLLCATGILTVSQFLFCEIHLISMVILTIYHYSKSCRDNAEATICIRNAGMYAAIGALCWLVDRVACHIMQSLPINPQLHSFWHIFTAIAIYYGFKAMSTLHYRTASEKDA